MLTVKNSGHKNKSPRSRVKTSRVLNFMILRVFVAREWDSSQLARIADTFTIQQTGNVESVCGTVSQHVSTDVLTLLLFSDFFQFLQTGFDDFAMSMRWP